MTDYERQLMDEIKQAHIKIVALEAEKSALEKSISDQEDKLEKIEFQYADQLDELDKGDSEHSHFVADNLLVEYLKEVGMSHVAEAFERTRDRVNFWYS